MKNRILIAQILLCCPLRLAAQKNKTAGGNAAEELDFRLVPVPASVFSTPDPSSRNAARKPKPGVRQMEGNEPGRFDVREFLSKYGVSFPAGSMAFYDGALVVRDTAPNLTLIDRIFEKCAPGATPEMVSIELSTYECTLPPSKKLLPWEELMFADLVDLPKGSVKLVDRNTIVTKSGQRCISTRVTNAGNTADARKGNGVSSPAFHPGEAGSLLELEPVVGPDDETVDINLAYQLRTKLPGAGDNGYAELKVTTSFAMWIEHPLVVHSAPVEGQPGKYFVVVARVQLMDLNEFKLPPPEPGVKPGVVAATPKAPGLPPPLLLKRYKVPPGFFSVVPQGAVPEGPLPGAAVPAAAPQPSETTIRMKAGDFLSSAGVTFPPGSQAFFDPATSTLIIINTQENIDLVDRIVDDLNNAVPIIVSAELSAYECDFSEIQDKRQMDKLTFGELTKRPRNSVKAVDCVSVITKSGQGVVTTDVAGPDFTAETNAQQRPDVQVFQAGETGTGLDVEPVVGHDAKKIDAKVTLELRLAAGAPGGKEIVTIKNTASFTAARGEPHIVLVSPVEDHKGKYIVVVMRMRLLSPGGWDIAKARNYRNPPLPAQFLPTHGATPATTK